MQWKGKNISKKETSNFKLPNLCGNQLISTAFVFAPSVFEEKFPTAEF
jgi:hypothetical protein